MKMKAKGFTLIELAVVLAVIAVLAAILTPMVSGYIDQARGARAQAEVKEIANALMLYQRDVGEFPIFNNTTDAGTDTPAADYIRSGVGSNTTGSAWTGSFATTSLDSFLNNNYLGKTVMLTTGLGKISFRGPYIAGLDSDPWSNKYVVTAINLKDSSANWAYVVSAGPNGTLDTSPAIARTTTLAASSDDFVSVIK